MIKADALSIRSKTAGTRHQILDAAIETLKEQGFAATTTRAIARRGAFNQALVFYHFGSLNGLLLAALDRLGEERMERFRALLDGVASWDELVRAATEIYREDLASGHMAVISQLVAGSIAHPDLGPEIVARLEPWIEFAEEAIGRVLAASPLVDLVAPRELAFAAVTFYLGLNLLTELDVDRSRTDALFEAGTRLAAVVSSSSSPSSPRIGPAQ